MRSRFQFSIRLLLVATAAVGAVVAAAAAEPSWQSCVALEFLALLFASIAIIAAFKSYGAVRVFWVAAAVPAGGATVIYFVYGCIAAMSAMMMDPGETLVMIMSGLRVALPALWCLSLANGLACSLVYCAIWPSRDTPGPIAADPQ